MAAVNPPWACQGRTDHSAQGLRLVLAALMSGPIPQGQTTAGGGIHPVLGNLLNPTGQASMNVNIDTGFVFVPSAAAWNGLYGSYNAASVAVPIPAASTTQFRRDWIVAQVIDPGDNTANLNFVDIAGAFSSTAPAPLPSLAGLNVVPIAIAVVNPNQTVMNGAGAVVDQRVFSSLPGGLTLANSTNRPPTTAAQGTSWFEGDTGLIGIIVNGAYQFINPVPAPSDPWHYVGSGGNPAFATGWANFGAAAARLAFQKTAHQNQVWVSGVITPSAGATANVFTLPAGYQPASTQWIWGLDLSGPTVAMFTINTNGLVSLTTPAPVSGHEIMVNGFFSLNI